uniref:Large ribosomal subunit protein bL19m n=1 Tax=Eptatretus burgeri TaxID=7764 RepID=A0A8C4QAL2_EPTBU
MDALFCRLVRPSFALGTKVSALVVQRGFGNASGDGSVEGDEQTKKAKLEENAHKMQGDVHGVQGKPTEAIGLGQVHFTRPTKPTMKKEETVEKKRIWGPEFELPQYTRTTPFKYHVEHRDMFARRQVIDIPEFHIGSILAITRADPFSPSRSLRFVGICIRRGGYGLGATCTLRNVIAGEGVEICFELYSPIILSVSVLRLARHPDSDLRYLRDAPSQYSTVPVDSSSWTESPAVPVPLEKTLVQLRPRPWSRRWWLPKYNITGAKVDAEAPGVIATRAMGKHVKRVKSEKQKEKERVMWEKGQRKGKLDIGAEWISEQIRDGTYYKG